MTALAPQATATRAQPTRALILDAAERLFAARGVDGIAVRDIGRELGITASSLYNHFPSKDALYEAVLERGLGPMVAIVAEAWERGVRGPEDVRQTLDRMVPHLVRHPHLAPLLQRAMLEESTTVQSLLGRWFGSLYREGVSIIRDVAGAAGWKAAEVPHLAIALFGLVFGYFVNAGALRQLGWQGNPMSARALALQRGVLEEAIFRLIGPGRLRAARRKRSQWT